jgi:transcriptional regulator with XRE-family HTH domain
MQYLSELERGRKEASSEILAAICDALSVELPDVLAEVGRDLAGAGARQQAIVLRLGIGPSSDADGLAASAPFRSHDVVSLLAA